MSRPIKIAVAGTHSTGKSTFLDALESELMSSGLKIGRVQDLARGARDFGFPILTAHNYLSTLWIMTEALRQEAELALTCDLILVDRPLFDALGYLKAALAFSSRAVRVEEMQELESMARMHLHTYDKIVCTALDPSIPLGEGRDGNLEFRKQAASAISRIVTDWSIPHVSLSASNRNQVLNQVREFVQTNLGAG